MLHLLAGTRRRLLTSTGVSLLPLFMGAHYGAHWIRSASSSPGLDTLIITGWLLVALGTAYLMSLLVGDLVFPRGWREVQILSQRDKTLAENYTAEEIVQASKGKMLPFAGIWVALILTLSFATHSVTDGFFDWYSRYGFASSALRGSNSALKVKVLQDMTRAPDDRLTGYSDMALALWNAPEKEVRLTAIRSLGNIGLRMSRSVALLDAGQTGGEWVRDLLASLQRDVAPLAIRGFIDASDSAERSAFAYVLGGLRPPEMGAVFEAYFSGANRDPKTDQVIVLSLAESGSLSEAIPLIRTVILTTEDTGLLSLALWAAGELYGLGTGQSDEAPPDPELVASIKGRLLSYPAPVQCVALDTLTRLRTEETNKELFTLFASIQPPDARCERLEIKRILDKPVLISRAEEVREKIVKALAAVADGNDVVMSWLERQSLDPDLASGLRSDMRYILDVLAQRKVQQ